MNNAGTDKGSLSKDRARLVAVIEAMAELALSVNGAHIIEEIQAERQADEDLDEMEACLGPLIADHILFTSPSADALAPVRSIAAGFRSNGNPDAEVAAAYARSVWDLATAQSDGKTWVSNTGGPNIVGFPLDEIEPEDGEEALIRAVTVNGVTHINIIIAAPMLAELLEGPLVRDLAYGAEGRETAGRALRIMLAAVARTLAELNEDTPEDEIAEAISRELSSPKHLR